MHALLLALALGMAALAGCLGSAPGASETEPSSLSVCIEPCARLVDGSTKRSFESAIARNPMQPDNILIGSSSWRGTGAASGPVGLEYHVSFDGGATFETSSFPGQVAPDHPLALAGTFADPWVVFLEGGTALYSAMIGRGAQGPPEALVPAWESFDIAVARSTDGGRTWPEATFVSDTIGMTGVQNLGVMNDQPFMTLGPEGDVLMVWVIQVFGPDGSFSQNVAASVSKDGGRTWSEAVMVTDGGTFRAGLPAITASGDFFVALRDRTSDGTTSLVLASSADGGESWTLAPLEGMQSSTPTQMAAFGDEILLTYGSPNHEGHETVHLRRSLDGGVTWSDDVLARSDGPGPSLPAVDVVPTGSAYVTYYVTQADGRTQPTVTRIGTDGGRTIQNLTGATLEPSTNSGVLGWPTYGDYQGLWADDGGAVASWLAGVAPDTDLMTSRFHS